MNNKLEIGDYSVKTMKRLVAFIAVLFVSVVSSACINNFAIQELNSKAKEYLDKGNVDDAICRLESSVDLDANIFESRYNLGVAFIQKENFKKAIIELNEAIKIKNTSPDAFYSLGVAQEGEAFKRDNDADKETLKASEAKETDDSQENSSQPLKEEPLSFDEAKAAVDNLEAAISSYNKYLELSNGAPDSQKVKDHIEELKGTINEYQVKYLDPASNLSKSPSAGSDKE